MATIEIHETKEIEITYMKVNVTPRYWEDAKLTIDGVEIDMETGFTQFPFFYKNRWIFKIDVDKGVILDWPKNCEVRTFFKVCDDGYYDLLDSNNNIIREYSEIYVPSCLGIDEPSGGDYLNISVNSEGQILNWNKKSFEKDFSDE
jgi:hypothetical protein